MTELGTDSIGRGVEAGACTPVESRPARRPSIYTEEIVDRICERIARGEALHVI